MMKKIILSSLLLLVSFSSFSQDAEGYTEVATSKDGDIFSVYIEKTEGDRTEFWLKTTAPIKTIKGKNGKTIKKGGEKVLWFVIMDCPDKTYSTSNYVFYDSFGKSKDGSVVLNEYNKRVVPGTVMNIVYDYVCKKE